MIGRTKTVIIFESGEKPIGILTDIVVQTTSSEHNKRITFHGPVNLDAAGRHHASTIILPIIDRITDHLGVPRQDYDISIVNLGATASAGIGIEIGGFSLDLPLFLAMLSASLKMGLRPEVVSTGHIASLGGDLAPVKGITAKLESAVISPHISEFVFPDLDTDRSSETLTPTEYRSVKESLLHHKGLITIHAVKSIEDVVKIFFPEDSIVRAGLVSGFFTATTDKDRSNPVDNTIKFLTEDSEKRFWDCLGTALMDRDIPNVKRLLTAFMDFHIGIQKYPDNCGEKLFRLVVSLPPRTRGFNHLFPLVPIESCIKLSQFAAHNDYEDVGKLYDANRGELHGISKHKPDMAETAAPIDRKQESELLEWLLAELSEENLVEKVGRPFDEARMSFVTNTVTVTDGFEFNEAISAFYGHILRHTGSLTGQVNKDVLTAEAIDLVAKTFQAKGGYRTALAQGMQGTKGGMRLVFDELTEYIKQKNAGKYIEMVFKQAISPLDWDTQVKLMETFKERIISDLPDDMKTMSAKQLAQHWEEVLRCYTESADNVKNLLKRF